MTRISPMFFMGVVTSYCSIFGIDWEKIQKETVLPAMNTSIPRLQLTAVLQKIQLRWTEAVTGRLWDGQEFYDFWWDVALEIANGAEDCPEDQLWELWYGQMWKRVAEKLLGLNVKGE